MWKYDVKICKIYEQSTTYDGPSSPANSSSLTPLRPPKPFSDPLLLFLEPPKPFPLHRPPPPHQPPPPSGRGVDTLGLPLLTSSPWPAPGAPFLLPILFSLFLSSLYLSKPLPSLNVYTLPLSLSTLSHSPCFSISLLLPLFLYFLCPLCPSLCLFITLSL